MNLIDLKHRLRRYLRGKQDENEKELGSLIRDGIITQAPGYPRLDLLEEPPVPCQGDVAKVLIEERGGR